MLEQHILMALDIYGHYQDEQWLLLSQIYSHCISYFGIAQYIRLAKGGKLWLHGSHHF